MEYIRHKEDAQDKKAGVADKIRVQKTEGGSYQIMGQKGSHGKHRVKDHLISVAYDLCDKDQAQRGSG